MTNLGFHRLMEERGIRVVTTDVGDRYVLEALRAEGGMLGGEQSGHVIYLATTSRATGSPRRCSSAARLDGRTLAEAAAVMPRYPQAKENVRVAHASVPARRSATEVERLNAELDGRRPRARASVGHGAGRPGARRGRKSGEKRSASVVAIATLVARELG